MPYDYVLYVDESGDTGLNSISTETIDGATEWFVLGGVLVRAEIEDKVARWSREFREHLDVKQARSLHYTKLSPQRKLTACGLLGNKSNTRVFTVISNKRNIENHHNPQAAAVMNNYDWFYCWMIRLLLERVTEFVENCDKNEGRECGQIRCEFSKTGALSGRNMRQYFDHNNFFKERSRRNTPLGQVRWQHIHAENVFEFKNSERSGLQMADLVAGSFYNALEHRKTKNPGSIYAKQFYKVVAKKPSTGRRYGFGVKLLPSYDNCNFLTNEQRSIFEIYGYGSGGSRSISRRR